jgi:hypothetical protein
LILVLGGSDANQELALRNRIADIAMDGFDVARDFGLDRRLLESFDSCWLLGEQSHCLPDGRSYGDTIEGGTRGCFLLRTVLIFLFASASRADKKKDDEP